jgi:PBP1b-binding outer membrane lipoprotein LpoB
MKKRVVALLAAAVAMSGCANLVGPQDDEAQALQAKKSLEAASQANAPSFRLAAN